MSGTPRCGVDGRARRSRNLLPIPTAAILLPVVPARCFGSDSACAMTGCVVPFFREIVEIFTIERENAAQTGIMEQTESSDGMIWIFQGKSGKQTDSRSSVLILPVSHFRGHSRLFRCSRFHLKVGAVPVSRLSEVSMTAEGPDEAGPFEDRKENRRITLPSSYYQRR
jgi:hypothetical protein